MSYDAIVVGAGISGAATAYHLKKAGAKVLLLERGEPASGGTGKSAAIIRQSYSTPLLVRLARASIAMFGNAKAELGRDAGFVQSGYCFLSRARCWRARGRTSRCSAASASSTNGRDGAGLSAASARDQSRRHRRHRLRAARRLRRSGAGDRGLRRGVPAARRRVSPAHAGAAAPARGRPHRRRRARQRRGRRRTSWSTPPARGRNRWPKAPASTCRCARCASRTRCGRCRPGARCRRPRSRTASTRSTAPARTRALHHRARLSQGVRRRRSLQLQDHRRRRLHRRCADARRAPLPGLRRHEADRGLRGALRRDAGLVSVRRPAQPALPATRISPAAAATASRSRRRSARSWPTGC